MKKACKPQSGFTLVETLVSISVIAVLLGILMPSLQTARQQAQRTVCLNNLRQMALAAQSYSASYDDRYPLAYDTEQVNGVRHYLAWDFSHWKDWDTTPPVVHVEPGLLWMGQTIAAVQQCPAYKGPANWLDDPYTGYNYNTSYLGINETVTPHNSAKTTEVRSPAKTALFGDGQYAGGADKFMRAPWSNPRDASFGDNYRCTGTQGFRHLKTTNIAFCDGHAAFQRELYIQSDPVSQGTLEAYNQKHTVKIGFLSPDNRFYDLK